MDYNEISQSFKTKRLGVLCKTSRRFDSNVGTFIKSLSEAEVTTDISHIAILISSVYLCMIPTEVW